jgi:hypothetical protein
MTFLSPSLLRVVGHEPETLPDVRGADARSAQIERCEGVVRCFQVSVNKVEPLQRSLARNLLSKDDWRSADFNEVVPCGPEVPLVSEPLSFACSAETLAWA